MANSKASSRGKRGEMYSLDRLMVSVHHSAAGTAWRWRTELAVLAFLLAALIALSFVRPVDWTAVRFAALVHVTSLAWGAAELAAIFGALLGVPVTRRAIIRHAWCVLARHRFQRLCWEARLHTRAGKLPAVLWVSPTKVGERLFVWCLAGIAAEDFEQHTGELRAACYARDARVTRNPRWSQLVTIDIIRRDTLAATQVVHSPLKATAAARRSPSPARKTRALSSPPDLTAPAWPDGPAWGDVLSPE